MRAIWNDLAMMAAIAGPVCAGLVFAAAGAQKLRHRALLRGVIANYRILPYALTAPAALLLPPLELALGFLLLTGLARPWAPLAATALLLLFALAMAVNIGRGRAHIDCGCGDASLRQPLRPGLVVRNLLLAALLVPPLAVTGAVPLPVLLAGIAAGLAFFLLYAVANVLAGLPDHNRRANPVAV